MLRTLYRQAQIGNVPNKCVTFFPDNRFVHRILLLLVMTVAKKGLGNQYPGNVRKMLKKIGIFGAHWKWNLEEMFRMIFYPISQLRSRSQFRGIQFTEKYFSFTARSKS